MYFDFSYVVIIFIFTFTQGRYDIVCPIMSAWDLHKAWPEAQLKVYNINKISTIFYLHFYKIIYVSKTIKMSVYIGVCGLNII